MQQPHPFAGPVAPPAWPSLLGPVPAAAPAPGPARPRPHLGFSVNTSGDTDQFYAGLTWEWEFLRNMFAGFSLGGAIHDGETETSRTDMKELGCRLLFRLSLELGYRIDQRHGISLFLDHISNVNICDNNEGLETAGVRYGYRF